LGSSRTFQLTRALNQLSRRHGVCPFIENPRFMIIHGQMSDTTAHSSAPAIGESAGRGVVSAKRQGCSYSAEHDPNTRATSCSSTGYATKSSDGPPQHAGRERDENGDSGQNDQGLLSPAIAVKAQGAGCCGCGCREGGTCCCGTVTLRLSAYDPALNPDELFELCRCDCNDCACNTGEQVAKVMQPTVEACTTSCPGFMRPARSRRMPIFAGGPPCCQVAP
jgi:hypothetical protein